MGIALAGPAATTKDKSRKHESRKTRKGNKKNFVPSQFRVFVMENIFHKMKKISVKQLKANNMAPG
jgi:hypothetical protein